MYFENVKINDEVYGLIFGKGVVTSVWDGYYKFEVTYPNDYVVPYTDEGIPGWNILLDFQTVFYECDIDVMDFDFSPVDNILSPKEIIKLRNKKKLQVRCPSGLWITIDKCPDFLVQGYLENKQFHLFRKV
jgi:hypothetical protein